MTFKNLILEQQGNIATIKLNRPDKFNAFNTALREELFRVITKLENDVDIRVVIIKGEGPGFSAGADLAEQVNHPISDQIDYEYKPFLEKIHRGNNLYIAQVHSNASGAGASLALACDLMVMDQQASLYLAFAAITLIPDCGATWQLLQAMGRRRAMACILESTHISAQDCHQFGFANKLFPKEELDGATMQWAEKLAAMPAATLVATKRLLHQNPYATFEQAISNESQEQNVLISSEAFKQAVQQFFNRKNQVETS